MLVLGSEKYIIGVSACRPHKVTKQDCQLYIAKKSFLLHHNSIYKASFIIKGHCHKSTVCWIAHGLGCFGQVVTHKLYATTLCWTWWEKSWPAFSKPRLLPHWTLLEWIGTLTVNHTLQPNIRTYLCWTWSLRPWCKIWQKAFLVEAVIVAKEEPLLMFHYLE